MAAFDGRCLRHMTRRCGCGTLLPEAVFEFYWAIRDGFAVAVFPRVVEAGPGLQQGLAIKASGCGS